MSVQLTRNEFKFLVIKDTLLPFPELYLDVYINGPDWEEQAFAELFVKAKCSKAKTPESADLVVFVGGPDVNPALYGEKPHNSVCTDDSDDERDVAMYKLCYDEGIPMMGVCRGAQFLSVANGGKLYQHIDGHNGDHAIWDCRDQTHIHRSSSVHHQAVIPNRVGGMEVIANCYESRIRWLDDERFEQGNGEDIEAFFYRDTACLGFQGHPEYRGYHLYAQWCMKKLEQYICHNPDMETRSGRMRLKEKLLSMREALSKTEA